MYNIQHHFISQSNDLMLDPGFSQGADVTLMAQYKTRVTPVHYQCSYYSLAQAIDMSSSWLQPSNQCGQGRNPGRGEQPATCAGEHGWAQLVSGCQLDLISTSALLTKSIGSTRIDRWKVNQFVAHTHMMLASGESRACTAGGGQALYSLRRRRLISIGIPIINLRRSSDRLRFIMGIPIPVRRRLLSE